MGFMQRLYGAITRGAALPLPRGGHGGLFWTLLRGGDLDTHPIKSKGEMLTAYTGWVYAAVSALSQDVSASDWDLWEKTGKRRKDWKAVEEQQIPKVLLRPNSLQTWSDLAELTAMHLDLTGEAYWHVMSDSPGGPAFGVQVVYPHWIQEPIIEGGRLTKWRVNVPGWAQEWIAAEDLILLRYPHPTDPFKGASPVEAFAVSYDMDLYARAYAGSLIKNRARPDGILSSDQALTPEQADSMRKGWKERYQMPGEIAVLGRGSKYQPISVPLGDLEFLSLAQLSRDQILGIYRVPASKLGLVEDVNRANGEASDQTYKENAVLPRLRRIERAVNLYLLPRLMKNNARGFYWEYRDPVEENEAETRAKANDALQRGAITVNEYRELVDLDPASDGGDVYLVPNTVTPVKSLLDAKPLPLASSSDPSPAKKEARSQEDREKRLQDAAGRYLRRHERLEAATEKAARALFRKEGRAVIAALEESNVLRAVEVPQLEAPTVEARDWLMDTLSRYSEAWERLLHDQAHAALLEGWELTAEDWGREGVDPALAEYTIADWARRHAASRVTSITESTRDEIRQVIAEAIEEGLPMTEAAERLRDLYAGFSEGRAKTIARTETSTAMNRGKYLHAAEAKRRFGWDTRRTWVSLIDSGTRATHRAAHGQHPDVSGSYLVGGYHLAHPGDPSGPAKEIANCRCMEMHEIIEE